MKCDKNIIKNLAISKKLNFLIGSGVSSPAVPLMKEIDEEDNFKRNQKLIYYVKLVSENLLGTVENEPKVEETFNNYFKFIGTILDLLEVSNSRQTPKSVNIFSTNYDLFIEKSVDKLMRYKKFIFNDGASGYFHRILSSSNYNRVVSYKGINDNYINEIPCINLIKPHGSINWSKVDATGDIEIINKISNDPVIVPPNGREEENTFLNNHFHEMLRLFQLELDKPQSILIVIGFSFQDQHIAKMLKRAMQNPEIIIFIFCYIDSDKEIILKNLGLLEEPRNVKLITSKDLDIENEKQYFTIKELTEILTVNDEDLNYD